QTPAATRTATNAPEVGAGAASVSPRALVEHAQNALFLSLAVVLPVLAVAAVVGLVVAAFQAASQIQDPTIAHLPRLLAVVAALVGLGPWLGEQITRLPQS